MTVGCEEVYRRFAAAKDFSDILEYFQELCDVLEVDRKDFRRVYRNIKTKLQSHESRQLWAVIDKRAKQAVYEKNKACSGAKMVVIGAGPCGLRMAIEGALLGARVVVVEMRDYFARNNVLHLWPFVIHDLKAIGAKVLYPGFCTGSLNHISIRRLQGILLKIALLLGVEIHTPVAFEGLTEPEVSEDGTVQGWRLELSPEVPSLKELDIDIIVGADGKRNTLRGFHRKIFRGKQAIAITCNFVNLRTHADNQVTEIGGIFYVFKREFFDHLSEVSGIELENFVYYRNDTHYFVMTARKKSLLAKGVLHEDSPEHGHILRRENIDQQKLRDFAIEAATIATDNGIPMMQFAKNHHGHDDVAIFDFTQMTQATHSSLCVEREKKRLLKCIVGDSLIEPFWPTGSGCARGFLSVFDAAWMIKGWCPGKRAPLEVIGEREALLKTLSQSTPNTLKSKLDQYTIDPTTRYNYVPPTLKPEVVLQLWDMSDIIDEPPPAPMRRFTEAEALIGRRRGRSNSIDGLMLAWYQEKLAPYKDMVSVFDMLTSWRDGRALCALMHVYRPESIDMEDVVQTDAVTNLQRAFEITEREWGISPLLSAEDLALSDRPDALSLLTYLHQLKDALSMETSGDMPMDGTEDVVEGRQEGPESGPPDHPAPDMMSGSVMDSATGDCTPCSDSTDSPGSSLDCDKTQSGSPVVKEETVETEVVLKDSDMVLKDSEVVVKDSEMVVKESEMVESEVVESEVVESEGNLGPSTLTNDLLPLPVQPQHCSMMPISEEVEMDDMHSSGMSSLDVAPRHRGRRPSAISLLTGMSEMIGSRKRPAEPRVSISAEIPSEADQRDACSGIAARRIMAFQDKLSTVKQPKENTPPPARIRTWNPDEKKKKMQDIDFNSSNNGETGFGFSTSIKKQPKENTPPPARIRTWNLEEKKKQIQDMDFNSSNNEKKFMQSSPEGRSRMKELSTMFDSKKALNETPVNEKLADNVKPAITLQNLPDNVKPAVSLLPPGGMSQTSQVCCVCGKLTYILERQHKDRHFFHRQCCRCHKCGCTLRIGSMYVHEEGEQVMFLCFKHARESGYFTSRRRRPVIKEKVDTTDYIELPAITVGIHNGNATKDHSVRENGHKAEKHKTVTFNDQQETEKLSKKPHVTCPDIIVSSDVIADDTDSRDTNSRDTNSRDSPSRDSPSRDTTSRDSPSRDTPSRDSPSRDSPSRDSPSRDSPSRDVTVISHFKVENPSQADTRHVTFRNITLDTFPWTSTRSPATTRNDHQNPAAHPTAPGTDPATDPAGYHEKSDTNQDTEIQPGHLAVNGDIQTPQGPHTTPGVLPTIMVHSDEGDVTSHGHRGERTQEGRSGGSERGSVRGRVRFASDHGDGRGGGEVEFCLPSVSEVVRPSSDREVLERMTISLDDLHMNGDEVQADDDHTEQAGVEEDSSAESLSPGLVSSDSSNSESSEQETEEEEEEEEEEGTGEQAERSAEQEQDAIYDRKDSDITGDIIITRPKTAPSIESSTEGSSSPVVLRRKSKSAESRRSRPSTVYRQSASIRLLMAHEIQTGLEDVDQQEEALEERGRHVEQVLRGYGEEEAPDHDELLEEWMEVLQQKRELRNKEIRLLLKKKLLDLQEQKKQLQRSLANAEDQEGLQEELEQMEVDIQDVRTELSELSFNTRDSQSNLYIADCGAARGDTVV